MHAWVIRGLVATGDSRNRARRLSGANHTDEQEHHHTRHRQHSHSSHNSPFRSTELVLAPYANISGKLVDHKRVS